jgi:hypothetical protein
MSIVLRQLQGRKFVEFENLFDVSRGVPVLIVTFIALLELAKETLIEVTQAEAFAPIYVRLAYTRPACKAGSGSMSHRDPNLLRLRRADRRQRPGGPVGRAAPGAHPPRGRADQARHERRLQRLGPGRHCRRAGRGRQL